MSEPIRLVLALHNHQPIGNFDGVIEQAYRESYLPFLEAFERAPHMRIALHTSGSLMEWLDAQHPEYVDRLAALAEAGRIEIIGGAFFEPILTMLPRRDRIGQIQSYTRWLEARLGARVRGMWIPERVWEQSLVSDLVRAGIEYTCLDDFHFKCAGLTEDQLNGYYLTEDEGELLKVFPGSEKLRYVIPFGEPHKTIDILRELRDTHPGAVALFADDGEKFGTWPGTYQHVYENGWLDRFFAALAENRDWLRLCTLSEVVDQTPPIGKVYLPDGSYREMTEWALPTERLIQFEHLRHESEHDPLWPAWQGYVKGGFWRNFKIKYPESDEMYARMLMVSRRLEAAQDDVLLSGGVGDPLAAARQELYRGQCNCSYWHGAFGGIYLPHLRNAVFNHLIAADNLLDACQGRQAPWVEITSGDFNLDARQEVALSNDRLIALLAPTRGGQMYELDVRSICHNLLATLTRRPEAYHQKVLAGESAAADGAASIHDRVVFKQEGLNEKIQYDATPRKSLIDHFYDNEATLSAVVAGQAQERGDFVDGVYEARLRRNPDRVQVQLARLGRVGQSEVKIIKSATLSAGGSIVEIGYQLEGLPPGQTLHMAVEFNFAGMPAGADDRFFFDESGRQLGQLGAQLDLDETTSLGLTDGWLGMSVQLEASRPTRFWTFPIAAVSQSEGGFELVHQSVAVLPHWYVQGDAHGRWSVSLKLNVDTSVAESRMDRPATLAATPN